MNGMGRKKDDAADPERRVEENASEPSCALVCESESVRQETKEERVKETRSLIPALFFPQTHATAGEGNGDQGCTETGRRERERESERKRTHRQAH